MLDAVGTEEARLLFVSRPSLLAVSFFFPSSSKKPTQFHLLHIVLRLGLAHIPFFGIPFLPAYLRFFRSLHGLLVLRSSSIFIIISCLSPNHAQCGTDLWFFNRIYIDSEH